MPEKIKKDQKSYQIFDHQLDKGALDLRLRRVNMEKCKYIN